MAFQTISTDLSPPRRSMISRICQYVGIATILIALLIGLFILIPKPVSWDIYRANGTVNGGFGLLISDHSITSVGLTASVVTETWLSRLNRCKNLESLDVNAGAIGPFLKDLGQLKKLKQINVYGHHVMLRIYDDYTKPKGRNAGPYIDMVDSTLNCEEFLSLTHLETLSLYQFKNKIYNIDQLKTHPGLNKLTLGEIAQRAVILEQVSECRNIDSIVIVGVESDDDETANILKRCTHLKNLKVPNSMATDELKSQLPTTRIETWPN